MKPRILIIEDDVVLSESLQDCFAIEGMHTETIATKRQYLELAVVLNPLKSVAVLEQRFDLVLLDVSLPDGSGLEIAQHLRSHTSLPFLFMTARNEAEFRLLGFESGAVDFIPKPFHFRELLIRVRFALQRAQAHRSKRRLGDLYIDLEAQCLYDQDLRPIAVTQKDFQVLEFLCKRSPDIVSRDEILDKVWGLDHFPTPRTVDNSIVRLRKIFSDSSGDIIRSVRGIGYQLQGSF